MPSPRVCLAAVSSVALTAGLLIGVTPIAQAAPPAPAAPATPAAPAADGAAAERRGNKVVDLKGGMCASSVPLGLVRFDGPGGTRLTARVRAQGDARLLTIVSGSGQIGENVVRAKDVSGELTWRKGAMTGSVTITLPEHVKVSRTWAQDVTVNAQPAGCDWSAAVVLQARGEGATLDLRGPLTDTGSYVLRGSGTVSISRTPIPVTGFLRATNPGRSASTTWQVNGSTSRIVRIPGARLSGVKVSLGGRVPIVRGTASVRLDTPLLTAPAVLEVAGANTWSAQVNGSNRRMWIVPQTDQVVVRTSELRGSVGMRAGQPHWTLTAPGAARIGTLDYSVDVGFDGRLNYTVQARGAVGTFLGMPEQRPFVGVPTKLTITPRGITGALTVVTRGEILLDMPSAWRGKTDYILRPVPGQGWTFNQYISHALSAGVGTMRLTGPVSDTGGVDLIGSGTLDISGTAVPTRGYYKRTGFTDGSTPVWAMAAYLDEAPNGRIPLDGGAGFVGGRLIFNGTGAQPVSTIPDAAPRADTAPAKKVPARKKTDVSPASSPIVSGGQTLTTVAYEGFAYSPRPLAGASGGTGWTSAWASMSPSGGNYQVQATGLTYPDLTTTGGSAIWGTGGNQVNDYGRNLPRQSSGVVYVQALTSFGSQTGGGTPQIRFVDTSTGAATGGFGNNGAPNMAILDSTLNPVATSSTSMNGNRLTILRIDYGAKTTTMWVDPDLSKFDYANPPTASAQATGFAPVFDSLQAVTRSGQSFDEITVMTLNAAPPPPAPTPAPVPVTTTGTTSVSLSDADGDTFLLPVTYTYTDPNNWTATAAGTTPSNIYNPFTGLEIPETDFSGTITDSNGKQTWNVSITMQTWAQMAKGIDYQGAFTVSNECPLSNQANCPEADGIFVGGQSTMLFDDPSFPTATGNGAFLTDLSWGWWDATAQGSVSINGVTMSNPDLTVWRGTGTGPVPEIVMPDLSDLNGNGLNVEFCADFTVPVPYVTTINTLGCAEWTEQGSILAQINTGGSMATDDYNGVTVNSTTLTGYVWNGLDTEETVFLDGVEIQAEPARNYVTAAIVVPGNAMHDFGTGTSTDTVIDATGWFDSEGNFDIEGTIPVNLKGSGFTLEEILISISREKEDEQSTFDLRFDAECDVVINGNHFPLDVYIGYEKAGDSTITVGLSATGTKSTQPDGTMDFVNLVPSGDFEPENASIVDGSFDGKLPANILNDGGFERSTNPGNVAINGGFDDSLGLNLLTDGDFESGTFGNILPNGNFEDSNILVNAGFEDNGGSLAGWQVTSSAFTYGVASGSATGPEEQGSTVAILSNNSASNNVSGGLTQIVPNALDGSTITVTAWVMSNTSGNAPFHIQLQSNLADGGGDPTCNNGVTLRGPTVTAQPGVWTQATVSGTLGTGCFDVQVTLAPENSGTSVQIDAVEMSIDEIGQANTVGVVSRPNIVAPFDSLSTTPLTPGYSSGVSIATDYPGTLRTDGQQSWMLYSNTTGYSYGDFDVTYKVMFPSGSTAREIADFGFWLDGNYNSMNGYCFRLQTSGGDGGFFSCSKTSKAAVSGNVNAPDVARDHWYQVRLTAVSGYVTAYVIDLSNNNAVIYSRTLKMPSAPGGVFGQVPDGVSSSSGIRWDDIAINGVQGEVGWESRTYSPTQVWFGDDARSGSGRASLYSSSVANVPFEYAIDDTTLAPGQTYTYSAWVRAASGNVSGSISLTANGGTSESASNTFTVGTSWTQVTTTLTMWQGGHTELRPRITLGTTNAELQIDDQVLQLVPWYSNYGNSQIQVTEAEAYEGTNSLQVVNPSNSSSSNAFYSFTQLPAAGSVITATAWVKSPAGVSGDLFLWEASGSTSTPFTGTGTWQQVTVSRTSQGGTSMPDVGIDIASGHAGQALYVDDVQVVVTDISSTQVGYLGAPSGPGGWLSSWNVPPTSGTGAYYPVSGSSDPTAPTNVKATVNGGTINVTWSPATSKYGIMFYEVYSSTGSPACSSSSTSCNVVGLPAGNYVFFVQAVSRAGMPGQVSQPSNVVSIYQNVAPVVVDNPSIARSAPGVLMMQPPAKGKEINTYSVTPQTAPGVGSTWQASLWIAPGTSGNVQPVTVTVTAGSSTNSQSVTLSKTAGQYTNVVVPVQIASAASTFTVQITYTDAAGTNPIYVDDLSITEDGLTPVDPWQTYVPDTKGFLGIEGVNDPANAQSGDGYLVIANDSSQGAAAYVDDVNYRPKAGTEHEMSFWVKSPSGNLPGVAAWVRTQDAGGTVLDSYQYTFTATSTWQQVFISLPIKNTSATTLRTEIDMPVGGTVWIDGLESRDINYWSAVQPSGGKTSVTIEDNASDAANGQNYLRFSTSGSGGGMGDTITTDVDGNPIDVIAGSSYKLEAYVRSTTGAAVSGTMSLAAANGSSTTDSANVAFTAGSSWTPVQLTLDTTKNANTLIPRIILGSGGQLDVDELTLTPVIIEQTDPWSASGSGVTWNVMDDPANAYDSSYGVMEFSVANAGTGVQYAASASTSVGEQLSATAFVRTGGTPVSGSFVVTSVGGTKETWQEAFTANGEWQSLSIPIAVAQSGHTGFTVQVLSNTPGTTLYLDQVALQSNPWTASGSVDQAIVFDGAAAQSGSGYLELTPTGSSGGSSYLDMPASSDIGGTYAAGTTWIVTAYVKSSSDTVLASGKVSVGPSGGTATSQAFSVGSEWTAVPVSYTVGSSPLTSLRVTVSVNGSSVPVEIDSVSISDGTPPPDGITTPLPHPESGWIYLWNDAFGIPGHHLWAISAQVDFVDGLPGLGVASTVYQDPTKLPNVMSGTDWIQGNMAVNISESDPCFMYEFNSNGGNSGVSLGTGVFTAQDFAINFAPRGCQVGEDTLPKGASLSFDGELGDGTVAFDIAIEEGEDGPEFTEDIGITDITIGGFDFKEMELSIDLTATDDSITFVGDMVTPMGNFNGSYDLNANESELVMDGSVSLTDWEWAGGGFDVEEFDFDMSMTVPFGAGECGSFSEDANGLMDMGKKTSLSFTGQIAMKCGKLEVLEMDYDYHHGAVTEVFELKYDSDTGILAGEVEFDFDRSTSWKFFFHHYNRHPKFSIKLAYSMDVANPGSAAMATLTGTVSVSGGDGSLSCTLEVGSGTDWADDQCSLHVHIDVGGGHTYNASW